MEALAGKLRRRCRGADLLRAGARSDGAADRQDLREPAEGRRHPRSRSSRGSPSIPGLAHYIIHSFDVPALAPARARRGAPLREDRARRAARAPHAVAHLHARRARGRNRSTPTWRRPRPRARTTRRPRSCTRSTIRRTPTCRPRRTRRPGGRSMRSRRSATEDSDQRRRQRRAAGGGLLRAGRHPGALRARARRLGRGGGAARRARRRLPGPTPSRISPARSAPRAAATPPPRARTSSGWRRCATRWRRRTTPTGPSRWRFSGASRRRG